VVRLTHMVSQLSILLMISKWRLLPMLNQSPQVNAGGLCKAKILIKSGNSLLNGIMLNVSEKLSFFKNEKILMIN